MKDDSTNRNDGSRNENNCNDMGNAVSKHGAVKEVFFLPFLFCSQIGSVNAGSDGGVSTDESE